MAHNDCLWVVIIPFMADIICPHCDGELEMDDGASGDFECPLCDGEFEWDSPEKNNSNHDLFKLKQYSLKRNLTISMCAPNAPRSQLSTGAKTVQEFPKTVDFGGRPENHWDRSASI